MSKRDHASRAWISERSTLSHRQLLNRLSLWAETAYWGHTYVCLADRWASRLPLLEVSLMSVLLP